VHVQRTTDGVEDLHRSPRFLRRTARRSRYRLRRYGATHYGATGGVGGGRTRSGRDRGGYPFCEAYLLTQAATSRGSGEPALSVASLLWHRSTSWTSFAAAVAITFSHRSSWSSVGAQPPAVTACGWSKEMRPRTRLAADGAQESLDDLRLLSMSAPSLTWSASGAER
jgi:hypothetical protein